MMDNPNLATAERQEKCGLTFDPIRYGAAHSAAKDSLFKVVSFLRQRRKDLHYTQKDVATGLRMHQTRVSDFECMRSSTATHLLRAFMIAELYGCEIRVVQSASNGESLGHHKAKWMQMVSEVDEDIANSPPLLDDGQRLIEIVKRPPDQDEDNCPIMDMAAPALEVPICEHEKEE